MYLETFDWYKLLIVTAPTGYRSCLSWRVHTALGNLEHVSTTRAPCTQMV